MDLRAERERLEAAIVAGDATARIPLGCVLALLHEHELAIATLESAHEDTDRRRQIEARLALGSAFQRLGVGDAATTFREALERAIAISPNDPLTAQACWELGSLLRDEGLLEQAATIWIACAQPAWAIRARAFAALTRGDDTAPAAYVAAIAALDLALGDHPALVDVLLEAAHVHQGVAASAFRLRAIRVAQALTGKGSPRTANAWLEHAIAEGDASVLDGAIASVYGDTPAATRLLAMKALLLDEAHDREGGLRAREELLLLREVELGFEHPALIPLVQEIKLGWEVIGRTDQAERFLYRTRERIPPQSYVYRNLTYSIAHLISASPDEVAALWHDFYVKREAVCAAGSPELVEARHLVAAHEAVLPPQRFSTTALEFKARRRPDTVDGYLVLADELSQKGDPRGELIVVQHCLRATPNDEALLARQHELLRQHRHELLGPMPESAVRWHLGFFERVELEAQDPGAAVLHEMLSHPSAAYIRDLHVTLAYIEGDYPNQGSNAPTVIGIIAGQSRPSMRSLSLIQKAIPNADGYSWSGGCSHDASPLLQALPNLVRLHLGGVDLVHDLVHGSLEHLVLDDRPICAAGTWDLPRLRSLDWALFWSTIDNPTDCEFATIDPVWIQSLPALRDLTLRASFYDCGGSLDRPEIKRRIRMLERLCVPASALDDDPIDMLRRNADQLRHLARVLVTSADLDDPRIDRLRRELPKLTIVEESEFNRASIGLDLIR